MYSNESNANAREQIRMETFYRQTQLVSCSRCLVIVRDWEYGIAMSFHFPIN